MSEELQDFDEELERLCAEIKKGIDALPKLKPQDRQNVSWLQKKNPARFVHLIIILTNSIRKLPIWKVESTERSKCLEVLKLN